jgi:hypothetical protein
MLRSPDLWWHKQQRPDGRYGGGMAVWFSTHHLIPRLRSKHAEMINLHFASSCLVLRETLSRWMHTCTLRRPWVGNEVCTTPELIVASQAYSREEYILLKTLTGLARTAHQGIVR